MTPIFACGFECGQFGTAHWNGGGVGASSTGTVRSGARSFRANPTASIVQLITFDAPWGSNTRRIARMYVNFATLPSADTALALFGGGAAGPNVRFKQSDSKIYAAVGTTFGASGVTVTTGIWYRIDSDFNVNTSGADFCDVQVDGVACGQATATGLSSVTGNEAIGVLETCTADVFFDDYVASVTAADYPIGAGYVNHFVPTADGTHNIAGAADFQRTLTGTDILNATTTAFQLVDDVPVEPTGPTDWINMIAPPNATDYVECIFGPAPGISTPTVAPRAVEVLAGIHQAGTGTGNMEIRMNDNGTTNAMYTATTVAGVTSVAYKRKHYAVNIANGGAWTVAAGAGNFNNLRVRFGSPAAVDANPDQFFDCIMIEAEFAQVTAADPPFMTLPQVWNRGFGAGSPSELYSPCR